MSALVELEMAGPIAVVTLCNPPLNITTRPLTRALRDIIDRIDGDAGIRALVITGAGERAFNAGSDIHEMRTLIDSGDIVPQKIDFENETFTAVENLSIPTIAAVNGLALGGGLELALCCDLIVLDERARVGLPEITLGLFPGAGGAVRVTRRVGEGRAKQLILLGDSISAQKALDWGLVDAVAPSAGSLEAALELARRLAGHSPQALGLAKRAIALRRHQDDPRALELSIELFGQAAASPGAREGIGAFLEKRPPVFDA